VIPDDTTRLKPASIERNSLMRVFSTHFSIWTYPNYVPELKLFTGRRAISIGIALP
jgi:hypothetical protein